MEYTTTHGLNDLSLVKRVIDAAYETYSKELAEYKPSIDWKSDTEATVTFTALGKKVNVNFAAGKKKVLVYGKLPLLFKPFSKKITTTIGDEMEKWIEKAKNGEFDAPEAPAEETEASTEEASPEAEV